MSKQAARWNRRAKRWLVVCLTSTTVMWAGCLDSDIAKRFREAYAPGFIQGLSTAFAQPGQTETGLRQMGVALATALGGIIQPRTQLSSSSSGSSNTSKSSSRSSTSN